MLLTFITIEDGSKTNENKISSQLSSTLPQELTIDTEKLNTLFSFYRPATYLSLDKSFKLFNNAKNQVGTVYFNDCLSLDYDFEINMDISMFNRTGEVADGLAFGFTQSPNGTIGNYGSGMGVINTINTTALIIDNYKNTNDPNVPSLSIR